MARRTDRRSSADVDNSYDEARLRSTRNRTKRLGEGGFGRTDRAFPLLMLWFGVAALAVVGRLVYLQVVTAGDLSEHAANQRYYNQALHAKRGTIYDRNGNVLAVSEDCETIYVNPQELNDATTAARLIAESLGGKAEDFLSTLKQDTTFAYVRRQVDERVAQALVEKLQAADVTGIYLLPDTRRSYPYGAVGGQVLGFVGIDGDGLSGLESYYDDILKGEDGIYSVQVARGTGTPIAGADGVIEPAKNGTDIIISLDIDIQMVAEEQIAQAVKDYEADSGSVMVTDPHTGEILAICSTPLLDLTDVSEAAAEAYALKPVSSSYEPGSIFKVLTAAIGIEDGLIGVDSSWNIPAQLQVGDDFVADVDNRDYAMDMTLREIMRRSSNVGMALIGQEVIGAERFSAGVDLFQIGQATGIDYPGEAAGIVKGLSEYDGSTLGNMAFGQGLAVPMVQMVKAVGSIANGGTLYTPHFLIAKEGEEVVWEATGTSVSAATCADVADMMRTVVQEGTAVDAAVEGFDVAAKTGTGQQIDEEHGGYKENSFVSSIIGFANADDPHVLVYVGLNGTAFHGSAAGGAFSAIMSEALTDMGVHPEGIGEN